MNIGFSMQAEHRTSIPVTGNFADCILQVVHNNTMWKYKCTQTAKGYFLSPTFRDFPIRNSFTPEIEIDISQENEQTVLQIHGQPVAFARIFTWVCISFALLMEIILIAVAFADGLQQYFGLFIPVICMFFTYFLCKFASEIPFRSIVKAIRKEFS